MTIKQLSFQNTAKEINKNLEKRNMEGYFVESSEDLRDLVLSMLKENATISYGGSETLKETGLLEAI